MGAELVRDSDVKAGADQTENSVQMNVLPTHSRRILDILHQLIGGLSHFL